MDLSLLLCAMGECNRMTTDLLAGSMPRDPIQRTCSTRHHLDPRRPELCGPISPLLLGPASAAPGSKHASGYFCSSHRAPWGG